MGAQFKSANKQMFNTLAGAYASLGTVDVHGMRLPAFDKNRLIDSHDFEVFDADCKYDVILGADFLPKIGMNRKFSNLTIKWLGNIIRIETSCLTTTAKGYTQGGGYWLRFLSLSTNQGCEV